MWLSEAAQSTEMGMALLVDGVQWLSAAQLPAGTSQACLSTTGCLGSTFSILADGLGLILPPFIFRFGAFLALCFVRVAVEVKQVLRGCLLL